MICHICQDNATVILRSANLSEDEKKERLLKAQQHLECAKTQRNHYREQVKSSRLAVEEIQADQWVKVLAVSLSYSFDHAQQVHYPSNPQQPGPSRLHARKCGIFGVWAEGSNTQLNYLIDEAQASGNGANSIVSMVHHYLQHYTCGEENIHLHADNCLSLIHIWRCRRSTLCRSRWSPYH